MHIILAKREAEVMEVLWERGRSTVSEVREKLKDALAYTTVLTTLRNLETKEYVGHEGEGRAHRYFARIARDAARRSALHDLAAKLFKGSTELLLTHMVADEKLSDAQVRRIRRILDARSGRNKP
jgi:BlaI family penicillinase repressor